MYSIVEDCVARWLGVTLISLLGMEMVAVYLLEVDVIGWKGLAMIGLSASLGTLHVVLFLRKRPAGKGREGQP
jgi:hypothetical protein